MPRLLSDPWRAFSPLPRTILALDYSGSTDTDRQSEHNALSSIPNPQLCRRTSARGHRCSGGSWWGDRFLPSRPVQVWGLGGHRRHPDSVSQQCGAEGRRFRQDHPILGQVCGDVFVRAVMALDTIPSCVGGSSIVKRTGLALS